MVKSKEEDLKNIQTLFIELEKTVDEGLQDRLIKPPKGIEKIVSYTIIINRFDVYITMPCWLPNNGNLQFNT